MIFFRDVLLAAAIQLGGVLGIFFVMGFVLSKLQEWTQRNYACSVGWKGILWTAWIGTPIHELGHYIFAKLFRHRVQRVALFDPDKRTGELGRVEHTYDAASLYQKIGNFFIGAAPLIFGATFLWLLMVYLLPGGRDVFAPLRADLTAQSLLPAVQQTLYALFLPERLRSWPFWLFLYTSFAVASHLAPSRADRRGMWHGLFSIILLLCIINVFAGLTRIDITEYILRVNRYLGTLATIFTYAILISILHWIVSTVILYPFRR